MRQPQHNPKLVHLVNVSGHSSTAFFSPVDMRDILVELNEPFTRARAVRLGTNLSVTPNGSGSMFARPISERTRWWLWNKKYRVEL